MELFHDDEKPGPCNRGKTYGLVTIKPTKYYKDDAALTEDTVTAEVEINATPSTTVREGLDLVIVLDVSGTMAEEKLESMKRAMEFVIMKLTAVDRLSIVTFSDVAKRHNELRSMTPDARNELTAIVKGLTASGPTNIQAGLETGLAVIAGRVHTEARTANIFLMSDGHENFGDAKKVVPGKVTIYTFGFGEHCDHDLMHSIASKSPGGTFSTVPDGADVSVAFAQLLAGLQTVVAQDVVLTLTPKKKKKNGKDDSDLEKIEVDKSTKYKIDYDPNSDVTTISFGTLFAGEGRRVVIRLKLKDMSATKKEYYDAPLAEAQHSYTAQGAIKDRQVPQDIDIRRKPNPSTAPGASSKARQVQAELARRNQAKAIEEARSLADKGKLDEARYRLVEAQNDLEDIVLENLDGGQKLVDSLRAELVQLIKLMETPELYNAEGRAYALASETSHGCQRYAARGSDEGDVRIFATPRMDTYRDQAKKFEKNPKVPVADADKDVQDEILKNPMSAVSTQLALYLQTAIDALQAIQRIVADPASA